MDHALSELIQRCSSDKGVTVASYTSYYGIQSNFSVPVSKFGEFIKEYCKSSYEDEQEDMGDGIDSKQLYIGECIDTKTTLPLMGNFSFKFEVEEGEEDRSYYTESLVLKIVKCYQRAITELLDVSPNMAEYICCVLENHSHRKGEYVRINLLLQFPFCQIDIRYMKTKFKNHVIKLLRNSRVMESFDTIPVGDWSDMLVDFDKSIPMYRSSMDSFTPHMKLNHIYSVVNDDHIESECGPELDLTDVFNPTTHSFIHNGKIPRGSIQLDIDEDEDEEYCRYWVPLFLSIHFWGAQTNPKEIDRPDIMNKTVYDVDEMDSENPIRMASSLLALLSIDRFNKDYSWLDIGRVLFNIYKGTEEGLNIWASYSNKSTVQGRDKAMCKFKWSEFKKTHLTVKTLAWYAKQDNPTSYEAWHTGWCQKALNEAMSMTHLDVAKAIHKFLWLDYVYSGDTKIWYQYRDNYYYKIGVQPFQLRKDISEKFLKIYTKMNCELSGKQHANVDNGESQSKDVDFKVKAIQSLISKLKNENYRSTVVKSLTDLFHVEEFESRCDKNHLLTALGNCILEVVDKRIRPRPGKPEDFIIKYSEIMYPFDYDWDSYWVVEVLKWFDQICVRDGELKHYFLKRLSSFLRGLNSEKLFDVWTNSGNGGKSVLTKTLQYIFGKYFVDFPTALLMGNGKNSNSGAANPELAQAANARGAILSEPDDRETMKGGIIKRITGGDRIFTRGLHENGGSMELTFKTIMVCNRIPDIANVDKALINRFVIMPFLGTWCEDAPETEEEQFQQRRFKMDPFFESKIPELARALLWVMVQYYKNYAEEGLSFPAIVKEYIKRHWEENDYYLQFIAENIEYAYKDADKKEINTSVSVTIQDVYRIFTRWFKDFYPGMSVPTASQVKSDLEMTGRLGGQVKRGHWLGIQVKQSSLVPQLGNLGIANI